MKEIERMLRREIIVLEAQNEELRRKLQIAENMNFDLYRKNQDLSYYIRNMEGYANLS